MTFKFLQKTWLNAKENFYNEYELNYDDYLRRWEFFKSQRMTRLKHNDLFVSERKLKKKGKWGEGFWYKIIRLVDQFIYSIWEFGNISSLDTKILNFFFIKFTIISVSQAKKNLTFESILILLSVELVIVYIVIVLYLIAYVFDLCCYP